MLAAYPTMRAAARRSAGFLNAHGRYDAATARSSLDASLRALRTDYIDILFLHEPMIDRIGDDLLGQLERERTAGRIRAFGVAGYPPALLAIQSELPAVTVVLQLPNDAIERQLERFPVRSGQAVITFSPFAGALEPLSQRLESDREFAATFALAYCLRANPTGVVLFSSTNPKRIRAAIRTADAPPAAGALAAFEAFVSAPPHAPSAAGIASGPPAAEQS
jgi:aryl-alcohol dehydrogenase-like predicted oxidoreductase